MESCNLFRRSSTVANANAETVSSLAYGTFPFTEAAALYKLTFLTAAGNANSGKVQLLSLTRIVGTTVTIAQTGINDHSGLSGLSGSNVHPALSVSTDITNFAGILTSSEVDVQQALDRIDDYAAPLASPTFTGKVTTAATGTGNAGLNLPPGTAPTSPVDGDVWTTTAGMYVRINGATVGPLGTGGGGGGATVSATAPSSPTSGQIWYDSTGGGTYVYYDSFWVEVGSPVTPSGAVGGSANKVFFENDQTVTSDYTITSGKNAISAGPITVNTGVVVTIPSGSTWTVV